MHAYAMVGTFRQELVKNEQEHDGFLGVITCLLKYIIESQYLRGKWALFCLSHVSGPFHIKLVLLENPVLISFMFFTNKNL